LKEKHILKDLIIYFGKVVSLLHCKDPPLYFDWKCRTSGKTQLPPEINELDTNMLQVGGFAI